ncbi:MAG: hypothetical protein LUC23_05095 [Prevotellaceae bacterium]|nr:hypothetical protein [Prevotellaceae bacterium]
MELIIFLMVITVIALAGGIWAVIQIRKAERADENGRDLSNAETSITSHP